RDLDDALAKCDPHLCSRFGRQAAAPSDDIHAKGFCSWDHLLADLAQPKEAERPAKQAAPLAVLFFIPFSFAEIDNIIGNTAVERENETESQLGNCDRVFSGAV